MTTRTLHPSRDAAEMVETIADAWPGDILDVTGLATLDDLRLIQACADSAGRSVLWCIPRNGSAAELLVLDEDGSYPT